MSCVSVPENIAFDIRYDCELGSKRGSRAMSYLRTLQLSNALSTVLMFVINMLASVGLINNTTPGALSDRLPNLFVPSGLTFSIWGVIYVLLFLFVAYQMRGSASRDVGDSAYLGKIGWLFVASNVFNIAWIFAWHYALFPLSLVFMILLFVSLLAIYLRLEIGDPRKTISMKKKFVYQVPFSVYLGWITVATIANVTAVLVSLGIEPFTGLAVAWTVVVIMVATLIAVLVLWTRRDIAYSLVIVWALVGIAVKRLDPNYFVELTVATSAGLGAAVILIVLTALVLLRSRPFQPRK
jgi:hypothetical protein